MSRLFTHFVVGREQREMKPVAQEHNTPPGTELTVVRS